MFQDNLYDNKPNRRGCNLPESNEDWQFERPWLIVSKDGEVKNKVETPPRTKAKPPKMRPISDILNKEVDEMEFIKLDMDKQIKMVAEEYNGGATISEIQAKFGINRRGFVELRDKAVETGLITELRKAGRPRKDKHVEANVQTGRVPGPGVTTKDFVKEVSENTMIVPPRATVEDFARQAEDKLELAERLAKEAELLQQAGHIALALTELLGDKADPIVSQLYTEVSA